MQRVKVKPPPDGPARNGGRLRSTDLTPRQLRFQISVRMLGFEIGTRSPGLEIDT
jgi:hypothetical protein